MGGAGYTGGSSGVSSTANSGDQYNNLGTGGGFPFSPPNSKMNTTVVTIGIIVAVVLLWKKKK